MKKFSADYYLNGEDEFNSILSDIRLVVKQVCTEFEWEKPSGIIGINKNCEISDGAIMMKVYPFDPSFPKKNIPNKYLYDCVKLICQDRPYIVFFHHKNINDRRKLQSIDHYLIELSDSEVVNDFSNFHWENKLEVIKSNDPDMTVLNIFDLVYFDENSKNIIAIPLPILSTPTFLIIIKNELYDNPCRMRKFIWEITQRTKDLIHFYIYNRLIKKLTLFLNDKTIDITTEGKLKKLFLDELRTFLLPIEFIAKKEKHSFVNDWPDVAGNTLELNLINEIFQFELTSYHIPINSSETIWIHEDEQYKKNKIQVKTMLENIFSLIFEQWEKTREAKDHATKAATSRIINRNYAHHIGSHVSHRATADKIFERLFGSYNLNNIPKGEVDTTLKSIVEMENRLTRYKDERNEFISGTDSNNQPVPVLFYKDIIQPFVENSLLMDNIAKSEGICWESENPLKNDGKVKEDGISKLRIRVFYHKDVLNKTLSLTTCSIKERSCNNNIPCMHKASEDGSSYERLSLSDLGIDNQWYEMMSVYDLGVSCEGEQADKKEDQAIKQVCIHRLPYYKKLASDGNGFFDSIGYSLDDIEVAIPGTLGTHSIFSLLENHIRNTAKHAPNSTVGKNLPVNVIIKISKPNNEERAMDEDCYKMEITSNVPTIYEDEQLAKIREALKEPVNIDTKALGFADMRISACLLAFRKINQFNLDRSIEELRDYYPKALPGQHETDKEEEKMPRSIGFSMLLTKPCKIVFVGKKFSKFGTPEREKQGIRQFNSTEECIKALDEKRKAFEFAVVDSNVFNEFEQAENKNKFLKVLPWRVLVPGNKDRCNELLKELAELRRLTFAGNLTFKKNEEVNALLNKCWDAWLRNRWQQPYKLNMFFDKYGALEESYNNVNLNKGSLCFELNVISRTDDKSNDNEKEKISNECISEVFYDRHGRLMGLINDKYGNDYSNLSWEFFDKNNPDFDIISTDQLDNPERSFSKLIESGIHKILIIDERAREIGLKDKTGNWLGKSRAAKQYSLYASASRVFIADSFVINDKEVLFESDQATEPMNNKLLQVVLQGKDQPISFKGKLSEKCKVIDSNIFSKFDTLIIHRTMLSKVINDKLFELLEKNFPNIVVTTGGGTLTYDKEVMDRIRVLPFSTVSKYLLNNAIAKNCITNLI